MVALDQALINPGAPLDVVGFHGEQLLQHVGGAVSLQGPHLHLTKTLATVLRLAPKRLLGDERVRAHGAGMYLVRHQMTQFKHVSVPNNRFLIERFPGLPGKKACFPVGRKPGFLKVFLDPILLDAVKNRCGDLDPEFLRRPAKVAFEHLPDIHSGRHTQRIEDEVHRRSIREIRHVLLGDDLGDNTLVAVAARHLVAH